MSTHQIPPQGTLYAPSGKIGLMGPVAMSAAGLISALILGVVYGIFSYYNPMIYFGFIGTLILGCGMGYAVSWAAKFGKVRSPMLAAFGGLVTGLTGFYLHWVAWAAVSIGMLALHPLILMEFLAEINAEGAWSMFGFTPTGGALYAVWGIEAAVIVGAAVLLPWSETGETPYCEKCDSWADDVEELDIGRIKDHEELAAHLADGNVEVLPRYGLPGPVAFSRIKLAGCPKCDDIAFLSIIDVKMEMKEDGVEEDEDNMLENMVMHNAELLYLRELIRHGIPEPEDEEEEEEALEVA